MTKEPLLPAGASATNKGGIRTMPFIIATEAFERLSSFGLMPNMIIYLTREYGMENAAAANVLFLWSAATDFLPILGALLADSYFGRYPMIGFGSVVSLLGTTLLWLTTFLPKSSPTACEQFRDGCESTNTASLMLLYVSFGLMSIGAGGIRSSCMAFGADQLDTKDVPENAGRLKRFFGWYYLSVAGAALVATTCVAYIQEHDGWKTGFGVPAMLMFLSSLSFFLATPFYIKRSAKSSLLVSFFQVIVASVRNRGAKSSPEDDVDDIHHRDGKTKLRAPSEKLRFLNNACLMKESDRTLLTDRRSPDPWRVCTVEQVEDLKALINVIPIWSAGIMTTVAMNQGSFTVLEAISMDRHITSTFEVPAASFGAVMVVSVLLLIVLYDRVFLPIASKIVGKPVNPDLKQRMGIGLTMSILALAVLAIVETVRRHLTLDGVTISAMWLLPHHIVMGFGEGLNAIAQNKFYYLELPRSMSSIAVTLYGVGSSLADLGASFIVSMVRKVTERGGDDDSWVSSDINRGHYDYYYWVIAGLCSLNLVYFVACSWAYGPCKRERDADSGVGGDREEESIAGDGGFN